MHEFDSFLNRGARTAECFFERIQRKGMKEDSGAAWNARNSSRLTDQDERGMGDGENKMPGSFLGESGGQLIFGGRFARKLAPLLGELVCTSSILFLTAGREWRNVFLKDKI